MAISARLWNEVTNMAGIDHTIIAFHNGKLMRNEEKVEVDQYTSLIPFQYTRDGELYGVDFDKKIEIPQYYSDNKLGDWIIRKLGTLIDKEYAYFYRKDEEEILVYKSEDYNVTFYMNGDESYVLLGGYGHWRNPYTHFFHRGYGEVFERQMGKECYEWLCEDVLSDLVHQNDDYYIGNEADAAYHRLCHRLRFKRYWDMNEEERAVYLNTKLIDYDEE